MNARNGLEVEKVRKVFFMHAHMHIHFVLSRFGTNVSCKTVFGCKSLCFVLPTSKNTPFFKKNTKKIYNRKIDKKLVT